MKSWLLIGQTLNISSLTTFYFLREIEQENMEFREFKCDQTWLLDLLKRELCFPTSDDFSKNILTLFIKIYLIFCSS